MGECLWSAFDNLNSKPPTHSSIYTRDKIELRLKLSLEPSVAAFDPTQYTMRNIDKQTSVLKARRIKFPC